MFVGCSPQSMITTFFKHDDLSKRLENIRKHSNRIGFVPTMGALHAGHIALMQQAMTLADYVVVSIFVNPTQFNNATDLKKYPRDLEKDAQKIEEVLGANRVIVYAPAVDDVYGNKVSAKKYDYDGLELIMEGANRPGHFDGVGTILEFLFNVLKPDVAVFGEKDFQQLQIVKKLVQKLALPIDVIAAPIYREENMLAMSSRNSRLTAQGMQQAAFIHKSLMLAQSYFTNHSTKQTEHYIKRLYEQQNELSLEYFTIAHEETLLPVKRKTKGGKYRAFIVAHLEGVRLIDNLKLHEFDVKDH